MSGFHENWTRCPGCDKERRVLYTVPGLPETAYVKEHNRWDAWNRVMVDCPGSGLPPKVETT